jgi:capsular polysaccharide biosynthesis protein
VTTYRAMLRNAWLLPLITLITIGAAALYTMHQPPVYRATMKMVIGQGNSFFSPDTANATEALTQTVAALVKSDVVASEVVNQLQLDVTPTVIINHLTVTSEPSAAVLDISYDDSDPTRGVRTLDAVASVFTEQVHDRLGSTTPAPGKAPVSVTIFDPAHAIPGKVSPKPLVNLAVAAALGLALGILVLTLLARLQRETVVAPIRRIDQESAASHS